MSPSKIAVRIEHSILYNEYQTNIQLFVFFNVTFKGDVDGLKQHLNPPETYIITARTGVLVRDEPCRGGAVTNFLQVRPDNSTTTS